MMQAPLEGLVQTGADLFLAFVLGALIGIERQWRQRTAGLRTNTLVAVGAAIFVDLALRMGVRPRRYGWWLTWYQGSVFLVPEPL